MRRVFLLAGRLVELGLAYREIITIEEGGTATAYGATSLGKKRIEEAKPEKKEEKRKTKEILEELVIEQNI